MYNRHRFSFDYWRHLTPRVLVKHQITQDRSVRHTSCILYIALQCYSGAVTWATALIFNYTCALQDADNSGGWETCICCSFSHSWPLYAPHVMGFWCIRYELWYGTVLFTRYLPTSSGARLHKQQSMSMAKEKQLCHPETVCPHTVFMGN